MKKIILLSAIMLTTSLIAQDNTEIDSIKVYEKGVAKSIFTTTIESEFFVKFDSLEIAKPDSDFRIYKYLKNGEVWYCRRSFKRNIFDKND